MSTTHLLNSMRFGIDRCRCWSAERRHAVANSRAPAISGFALGSVAASDSRPLYRGRDRRASAVRARSRVHGARVFKGTAVLKTRRNSSQ
eukprot:COSAG02_NODE_3536_length_6594_cov_4.786605_3_plen_90_part_00